MVVRFQAEVIRDVVERRREPIGVEGDPSSKQKGGVSEADKIVEGVKKKLDDTDVLSESDLGLNAKIKEDMLSDEALESPGPEVSNDDKIDELDVLKEASIEDEEKDKDKGDKGKEEK
jgi:protein phosphatase PTC1